MYSDRIKIEKTPDESLSSNQVQPNDNLTVILALKDRGLYTFRWMDYANSVHFPFKILIADGGSDARVQEKLGKRENYPNINYEYIQYPYDETYKHFYIKLVDAISRVDTSYLVMADNDDFFLIEGLQKSVDFLQCHPDFSSCRGLIGGIRINSNVRYLELSGVYGESKDIAFAKHRYLPGSTLDDTAVKRVKNFFTTYRANWYDVFRTEQAMANYQSLLDANINDLILAQNIPMLLGHVAGKVHRGSFKYLFRQINVPGSSDAIETREKGDHFDRMLMKTWSDDFNNFVNTIANAIAQKDEISYEEAYKVVKKSYREFMVPYIVSCLMPQKSRSSTVETIRWIYHRMGPGAIFFHRQYKAIRSKLKSQPQLLKFISGSRLANSDRDIKMLLEFLSNPPKSLHG